MKRQKKQNNGITLVALVITIILLLIIAGISISVLTNTGLFDKTKEAKQKTINAQEEEKAILSDYEIEMNKYIPATTIAEAQADDMLTKAVNSPIEDENGNKITIPAGFKVTLDETTVEKGIVIEDNSANQFVWIPVGTIYTNKEKTESKTIELGRYNFASDGTPSEYSGSFVEEDSTDTDNLLNCGNTIAKDINAFIASATRNGGYYIGRYEARTEIERTSTSNTITTITENENHYVYNYVTQLEAADLARNMYTSDKFTSDLINSYAWDTATLFLQEFGNDLTYSRKISVNSELTTTGTNNSDTTDVQCNVYDMASNVYEWTTETYNGSSKFCVYRGGKYDNSSNYTSWRTNIFSHYSYDWISFRPILYVE